MQELSLKSGGGRNFGRGRNLGRVRYIYIYIYIGQDGLYTMSLKPELIYRPSSTYTIVIWLSLVLYWYR